MTIKEVLVSLQNDSPVVVGDKTFVPHTVEKITLESGEAVYWAVKKDGTWMSVDPASDEIIMFEDIDEEMEPEDDTVVHGGADYEFSYEDTATMKSEEGEDTVLHFKEFESASGDIIRLTESEATGDVRVSLGTKVTEDELQEA